jgi:hypothetical protein
MRRQSATLGVAELHDWLERGLVAQAAVLDSLGGRPAGWREISDALALGGTAWPRAAADALRDLYRRAYNPAQRSREALELWRDAVLLMAAARELAATGGGSPATAGLAALVLRTADAVALGAIADVELRLAHRLDSGSLQALQVALAEPARAALLRQWRPSPAVAAALRDSRHAPERRGVSVEARALHFAEVLAGSLRTGFESPGLEAEIAAALQLRSGQLAGLRRSVAAIKPAAEQVLADLLSLGATTAAG